MRLITKSIFLVLITFSLFSCGCKPTDQKDFPQEIAAVYFQRQNAGQDKSNQVLDFFIELKNPLKEGMFLDTIYFRNEQAKLEMKSEKVFVAHFYPNQAQQDLILDSDPLKEYGNKAPVIVPPKFDLKPTEAVLEYKLKTKTFYYKITGVKEKPIIVHP